jgi:hypothetical protein
MTATPGYYGGGPAPHWFWSTCGQCGGQTRPGLPCETCGWQYGAVSPAEFGFRLVTRTVASGGPPAGVRLIDAADTAVQVARQFPDLAEHVIAVAIAVSKGWLAAGLTGEDELCLWATETGEAYLRQASAARQAPGS